MPLDQSPEPEPTSRRRRRATGGASRAAPGYVEMGYVFALVGALLFSTKAIAIKLAYADRRRSTRQRCSRSAWLMALPFYLVIGGLRCASAAARRRRCRRAAWCSSALLVGAARLLVRELHRFPRARIHLRPVRAADPLHLSALRRAARRAVLRPADPAACRARRSSSAMSALRSSSARRSAKAAPTSRSARR